MSTDAIRSFPLAGVLTVTTGYVVNRASVDSFHDLMDHLYPGIMTLGMAFMADKARETVLAQHPALASAQWPGLEAAGPWLADLIATHGETLPIRRGPFPAPGNTPTAESAP